jgi:mannosyl-glycoprotein endo-beta-N-acetylglucosaminidase
MLRASRRRLPALVLVASASAAIASHACAGDPLPGQPYASYWFPSTILDWDPATDPDAPFNRGAVPLATRFSSPDFNVNPHAHLDEARVQALVAFAPTSFNPSQGSATEDYYALNYWQYIDQLVFWGGSAGEGLILAPNPTVIDAAHRNGVPVLGNVYLPPTAYGGQIQWVRDFVQRDGSGNFPVADKMIEAAEYYGFDGWFINQETAGGDAELASDMRDMLVYFHAHSNLLITWYDAMTSSGVVAWQNQLDAQNQMFFQDGATLVSDDMFLNFNWSATGLTNSATLATSLGRSPYELYAGIDVETNGYNTGVNWAGVFPEGQPHRTSIGFYRPEWTHNSSSSVADFYARDNTFWVGPNGDPSNTTTSASWKGVAHYVPANSPITHLPFATNFNTGQGTHYFIDGVASSSQPWNNLSLQDVLPTWRWIMRSTGTPLDVGLSFDDAWWGGSSLAVSGTTDAPNEQLLYETSLPADDFLAIELVYRLPAAGPSHLEVGVAYDDDPSTFVYSSVEDAEIPFWVHAVVPVGNRPGQSVVAIALRYSPPAGVPYSINIGRLAIYATSTPPEPPGDLHIVRFDRLDASHATVRLAWTPAPGEINSYAVFQRHADDSETWLGGTPNSAYFVQQVVRDRNQATSTIEVETISPLFERSAPATVTVVWEDHIFADGFDGAAP